jgi:hypothetical protein
MKGAAKDPAGYIGTPLLTKLGVKDGMTLALSNAPHGLVTDLPPGVALKQVARGNADVVVAFFTERTELERRVDRLSQMIFPSGGLWIAWPKRTSGVQTDMSDNVVREVALPRGLVDNKVCAVDETWSALRIVWRRDARINGKATDRGAEI